MKDWGLVFCYSAMELLFAISVLSFLFLVAAGIAIVRHIRQSHRRAKLLDRPQSEFSEHLFRALDERDHGRPLMVRHQSIQEITANKSWNTPSRVVEIAPAADASFFGKRKGSRPERPVAEERLDWAYFNKDYGDLTDPYQSRRVPARSGAKSTSNGRA